ncbi:MAG: hypothetical protein FWE15_28825 [Actinomycetia bacterium]|nr:hypothetical protein [Actinomycetes bacterium]MCL2734001.1 hypothetical protein [Actinomycetes bacterium]
MADASETGNETGRTTEESDVTADPTAAGEQPAAPKAGIGTGPGRLLLWLYGIFTVAALSRSIVQISMKFHHAPLAYTLSAVAGVVYAVILVALSKGGESARRVALVCCSVELVGVLTVGTLTVADASAFADSTVWSYYGADYLLLPLALPVTGLLWLRRAGQAATAAPAKAAAGGEPRG